MTVLVSAGVNHTETEQLDPAARIEGQLLVSENPALPDTLNPFSGAAPKLVMVIACAELVVPTSCENVNEVGAKRMAEGRGLGTATGVAPNT